jgi:hypothetical protein
LKLYYSFAGLVWVVTIEIGKQKMTNHAIFNPTLCPQAVLRKPTHEDARDDLPIVNFLDEVRPLGCVLV